MARPPSTYEGRTSTGKPIRSATCTASSTERAVPFAGCVTPRRSASASKRPRSSAMSIESGAVPRIGTPAASSGLVKRSGVCPPSWTTTPLGRSQRTISSTSSRVSGSRSEEHTSELQSLAYLVCRLLLEKKKKNATNISSTLLQASYPQLSRRRAARRHSSSHKLALYCLNRLNRESPDYVRPQSSQCDSS